MQWPPASPGRPRRLPFAFAPAVAPAILAASDGSYGVLYAVAGLCAVLAALTIVPVKGVR
jgi:hypothetical protein